MQSLRWQYRNYAQGRCSLTTRNSAPTTVQSIIVGELACALRFTAELAALAAAGAALLIWVM